MRKLASLIALLVAVAHGGPARAEVQRDRFGAAGYFRVMARPDVQGGNSRLGYWNLYGRLLNEGPWGALELSLDIAPRVPGSSQVWTTIHAKVEGGSFFGADAGMGSLGRFGVTQMYVQAGNVLLDRVTWQLGTLDTYFGDLGLYDMKPAQLFYDTLGLSARYQVEALDVLLGVGDAGYYTAARSRLLGFGNSAYSTVLSGGGTARLHLSRHFELGGGAQGYLEPRVAGSRNAPHQTRLTGVEYEDFLRGEMVQTFFAESGAQPLPRPSTTSAASWKAVGYLGFGGVGPLRWSNLFASYARQHPDDAVVETYDDRSYTLYVKELTDERYSLLVGNELLLALWPERLDAAWAVLYGSDDDRDNTIAAGEDNREYASTVLRLQAYVSETVHLLVEGSAAVERSKNGNLWRRHYNSIFRSEGGATNARGLELGDSDRRHTVQGKLGVVLNPVGPGIYTRPSLRLLYGVQYSDVHAAYGNNFSSSLGEYDQFSAERADRHWHHVIALEAEGWF